MTAATWALLLITAAAFASSLPFNHVLVAHVPPLTVAALRAVLACPIAWLAMRAARKRLPVSWEEWRVLAVAGVLLVAIPFSAIAWGQQRIAAGLGGILYGIMPLLTVLAAHFAVPDDKLSARRLAGVLVGFAGVVVVVGPSALSGLGSHVAGEVVTLLAPLSYAIGGIYVRRNRHVEPLVLTTGMFAAAAVVLLPLSVALERPSPAAFDAAALAALLALAVVGTAVPACLNYVLIRRAGVSNASLVMFFLPVFAVVLGAVTLGERLQPESFAGLVLILSGSLAVSR